LDDLKAANQGIEAFIQWTKHIGAPQAYSELTGGITEEAMNLISNEVFHENNGTVGRLVHLEPEDIFQILKNCI
jgi:alcohol dehydrogenase YqhD (iron-dependent ADH family)